MWTHNIVRKEFVNGQVRVVINFEDKVHPSFEIPYTVSSMDDLKNLIQGQLKASEASAVFFESLPISTVDLTPKSATQDEIDKITWFDKYLKYKKLLQSVADGFRKSDDQAIVDLLTDLKATNKPEYGVF